MTSHCVYAHTWSDRTKSKTHVHHTQHPHYLRVVHFFFDNSHTFSRHNELEEKSYIHFILFHYYEGKHLIRE